MKQAIKSRAEISVLIGLCISMLMSMPARAQVIPGQNLWQEIAQVALEFNGIEDEVQELAYITSLIDVLQTGTTISASLADQLLDDTCEVAVALEDVSEELEIIACKMEALESIADQATEQLEDIENLLESDLDIFDNIANQMPEMQEGLEEALAGLHRLESDLDSLDSTLQDTQSHLEAVESIFEEIDQELVLVEDSAILKVL
jgi:chromosome segregation ATPase